MHVFVCLSMCDFLRDHVCVIFFSECMVCIFVCLYLLVRFSICYCVYVSVLMCACMTCVIYAFVSWSACEHVCVQFFSRICVCVRFCKRLCMCVIQHLCVHLCVYHWFCCLCIWDWACVSTVLKLTYLCVGFLSVFAYIFYHFFCTCVWMMKSRFQEKTEEINIQLGLFIMEKHECQIVIDRNQRSDWRYNSHPVISSIFTAVKGTSGNEDIRHNSTNIPPSILPLMFFLFSMINTSLTGCKLTLFPPRSSLMSVWKASPWRPEFGVYVYIISAMWDIFLGM